MREVRSGWHVIAMRCPDCDGGNACRTCGGTGWHPDSHIVNDGLFVDGVCVAKIECFYNGGPHYANAITTDGEAQRSGPMDKYFEAVRWCEKVATRHSTETEGDSAA